MRPYATKARTGLSIGWWGCASCGTTVHNNHTGPCLICGGKIGRMVPSETRLDADLGLHTPLRDAVPQVQQQQTDSNLTALSAAAVLCIASPLLGAPIEDWNAISTSMMLNIWAASVAYYALAHVRRSTQQKPQGAAFA